MKAKDLDRLLNFGEEGILPYLDRTKAVRPLLKATRVSIDFPHWMLARLYLEADRLGVLGQSLINLGGVERLGVTRRLRLVTTAAAASRRPSRCWPNRTPMKGGGR